MVSTRRGLFYDGRGFVEAESFGSNDKGMFDHENHGQGPADAGRIDPGLAVFGVWLTSLAYPGYNHLDQAMSQLGAVGAPTGPWSAWVNNYPLGVLFILFAAGVARRFAGSRLAVFSAVLILTHGLGSLATGYFPCDEHCSPAQPSTSQQLHNLSGLVMFLSLTLAGAVWAFLGKRLVSRGFAVFSASCVVLSVLTVVLMANAMQEGHDFGLHQRLNYGVSVIWCAALAVMALRSVRPAPKNGRLRAAERH